MIELPLLYHRPQSTHHYLALYQCMEQAIPLKQVVASCRWCKAMACPEDVRPQINYHICALCLGTNPHPVRITSQQKGTNMGEQGEKGEKGEKLKLKLKQQQNINININKNKQNIRVYRLWKEIPQLKRTHIIIMPPLSYSIVFAVLSILQHCSISHIIIVFAYRHHKIGILELQDDQIAETIVGDDAQLMDILKHRQYPIQQLKKHTEEIAEWWEAQSEYTQSNYNQNSLITAYQKIVTSIRQNSSISIDHHYFITAITHISLTNYQTANNNKSKIQQYTNNATIISYLLVIPPYPISKNASLHSLIQMLSSFDDYCIIPQGNDVQSAIYYALYDILTRNKVLKIGRVRGQSKYGGQADNYSTIRPHQYIKISLKGTGYCQFAWRSFNYESLREETYIAIWKIPNENLDIDYLHSEMQEALLGKYISLCEYLSAFRDAAMHIPSNNITQMQMFIISEGVKSEHKQLFQGLIEAFIKESQGKINLLYLPLINSRGCITQLMKILPLKYKEWVITGNSIHNIENKQNCNEDSEEDIEIIKNWMSISYLSVVQLSYYFRWCIQQGYVCHCTAIDIGYTI